MAPLPVGPLSWTDYLGLAPDCIAIYRTPTGAHAEYELANGPNPANHQPGVDIGGGIMSDGKIYFGERAVAAEYAGPTGANFAKGMVKYLRRSLRNSASMRRFTTITAPMGRLAWSSKFRWKSWIGSTS